MSLSNENGTDQKALCPFSAPRFRKWLRGRDLNPRPLGYEPNELPDCSTPRKRLEDLLVYENSATKTLDH